MSIPDSWIATALRLCDKSQIWRLLLSQLPGLSRDEDGLDEQCFGEKDSRVRTVGPCNGRNSQV
jgi:hypothetical protein